MVCDVYLGNEVSSVTLFYTSTLIGFFAFVYVSYVFL